jgi:hypothetical protein
MVVDIKAKTKVRLINIYRCFNPQEGISAKAKFLIQLDLINKAVVPNTFIVGDFNIDYKRRFDVDYRLRDIFNCMEEKLGDKNLVELVKGPRWSHVVLNVFKESILDHVYCTTPNLVENIHDMSPLFGDHKLIMVTLSYVIPLIPTVLKRDWRSYTANKLNNKLKSTVWENDIDSVQHYWNSLERKLVEIVDELAPMVSFVNKSVCAQYLPVAIKNKLNIRKRLLKTIKRVPSEALRSRIKNLNIKIKNYYHGKTKLKIRRGILPGNTKSLWDAV